MEKNRKEDFVCDRAWIEVDLDALEHNIREIERICSKKTKIMAVVKANAYGHGSIGIAKKLSSIGITDFAVATLSEGIFLRENGIQGNILILGYTEISHLHYVVEHDLIQTIVDGDYAREISQMTFSKKLKAHIKVNTGMNRIGVSSQDVDAISDIYQYSNIDVLGIFTHFCVADSNDPDDIEFSRMQIQKFDQLILELKSRGIDVGMVHMQSSYGILNYPELEYDYVRPGIILYGVHSEKNIQTKTSIDLKPVLSLKARITTLKELEKGDFVSYGRTYQASQPIKVASVSIGYADGYPRSLSGSGVKVLVSGKYAPIIGRICMDQLMIDVTGIDHVKQGDIVTLIGEEAEIRMEEIASFAGTITNDLASRLGSRLSYLFVDSRH